MVLDSVAEEFVAEACVLLVLVLGQHLDGAVGMEGGLLDGLEGEGTHNLEVVVPEHRFVLKGLGKFVVGEDNGSQGIAPKVAVGGKVVVLGLHVLAVQLRAGDGLEQAVDQDDVALPAYLVFVAELGKGVTFDKFFDEFVVDKTHVGVALLGGGKVFLLCRLDAALLLACQLYHEGEDAHIQLVGLVERLLQVFAGVGVLCASGILRAQGFEQHVLAHAQAFEGVAGESLHGPHQLLVFGYRCGDDSRPHRHFEAHVGLAFAGKVAEGGRGGHLVVQVLCQGAQGVDV